MDISADFLAKLFPQLYSCNGNDIMNDKGHNLVLCNDIANYKKGHSTGQERLIRTRLIQSST